MINKETLNRCLRENSNDNDAYILAAFQPLMLKTCLVEMGRIDEDAIQESKIALLKVARRFRAKRYATCTFVSYAAITIKNSIMRYSMKFKEGSEFIISVDSVILYDTKSDDNRENPLDVELMHRVIRGLDKRGRELFKGHYISPEKLTIRMLAKQHGISSTRVAQILKRVINTLRSKLNVLPPARSQ